MVLAPKLRKSAWSSENVFSHGFQKDLYVIYLGVFNVIFMIKTT